MAACRRVQYYFASCNGQRTAFANQLYYAVVCSYREQPHQYFDNKEVEIGSCFAIKLNNYVNNPSIIHKPLAVCAYSTIKKTYREFHCFNTNVTLRFRSSNCNLFPTRTLCMNCLPCRRAVSVITTALLRWSLESLRYSQSLFLGTPHEVCASRPVPSVPPRSLAGTCSC